MSGGSRHWGAQRLSAVALLPLGLYALLNLVCRAGADQAEITAWLSQPFAFGAMALFVLALFHHLALGLQVVIEDYVHGRILRLALLVLLPLGSVALAATALVALMTIAFVG